MNGQLYIECAKKGRNMGKPVKNRIRPVREVTEKDAEIAAANKGKNYNPYKAKKKTMIGVGIAAIILGIPLASIGGVGFNGIIVGIVLLIKGIKF
jgi:hypothetical protein